MIGRRILLALPLSFLAFVPAAADDLKWKKHDVNPKSAFESAAALDVDGDGVLDIVCGDSWYKGPDFKASQKVRDVTRVGTYYNDFSTLPIDVNGDGRVDFVTCSYFGKDVGWVENPGPAGGTWTYHPIDTPGNIEAAAFVDLDGDGVPEVLPNSVNVVVFYQLEKLGPTPTWKKYDLGSAGAGHGVGSGDVNGDGRTDILTPKGWYEAPSNPREGTWTFHPAWNLGATGIQIACRDVDGDGLTDLIWGMGHDYGLYWVAGVRGDKGQTVWDVSKKKTIEGKVASVHVHFFADLDGDGQADELLAGKRVYAHEVEPGDVDASVIAYYTYDSKAKDWVRHTIYEGQPAKAPSKKEERDAQKDFPAGTAGTGLQIHAIDIDGDGDIDLVCPGKSGLYVLENLTRSKTAK
ncbi:MAG: VCBS repeat-containing protein [Isosphaeraceae bacterium]